MTLEHPNARADRAELVMGEVVGGKATITDLRCATPGVCARQSRQRYGGLTIENRLYECANGLTLAARRGGMLHLAGADSWEVNVFTRHMVPTGEPVGWVSEEALARAVDRLAAWPNDPPQNDGQTELPYA